MSEEYKSCDNCKYEPLGEDDEPCVKCTRADGSDDMWKLKSDVTDEAVDHPTHYNTGNIETIDYIEAQQLNFHLGNAVKYISRAGKKGDIATDIRKAIWYLERYLEVIDE